MNVRRSDVPELTRKPLLLHLCPLLTSVLVLSNILAPFSFGQVSPLVPNAVWISTVGSEGCPVNKFVYFRKVVQLKSLSGDLTLQVAADSNAHVWINGFIVRRKVTRYFEHAITTETIDARPFLRIGDNTVVVLNHSWGPITTFQRSGCVHAGVWARSSWIVSDASWKSQAASEFAANDEQILGVPASSGTKGDTRIRFAQFLYGEKLPTQRLFSATFDDSTWSSVSVVEHGPWSDAPPPSGTAGQRETAVRPILLLAEGQAREEHIPGNVPMRIEKSMLHATYIPQGERAKVLPHRFGPLTIVGHAGETRYVTLDFGRPVHGFPFLTGTATKTRPVIDFGYGELNRSPSSGKLLVNSSGWLNPEAIVGEGYIDRYYAKIGAQHFELPDERTARWWTIHIYFPDNGGFRLDDAGIISSQYPVAIKGSFRCGDKRIDQVVRLSLEHAMVTMSDTYVDTPGREDGQWLEDARLRAQLSAQWFGDVKLRQLLIRLAAQSQMADGRLHPFPPSNYPIVANTDWAAEWVGALYDDYLWTGETSRLTEHWPQLVAWWNQVLSKVDSNGLWRDNNVFADIRVGVHPAAGQSSGIASAQIIQRLDLSIRMAKALHEEKQAGEWQSRYDTLVVAFHRDHLVPGTGGVPLHVDDIADPSQHLDQRGYSQAAQAMAVEGGLLTSDDAAKDLDYAFTSPNGAPGKGVDRWNNPTYLYRSLHALTLVGDSERAVQHLLERFRPYLPRDARNPNPLILQGPWGGPLPEYWISREDLDLPSSLLNPAQPTDPTGSHGWNSVALVWLHDSLLGVTILIPGGELIQISPNAAGLKYVEGTTMTPKGPVSVSWKPSLLLLSIALPAQTKAIVQLPQQLIDKETRGRLRVPTECQVESLSRYSCDGGHFTFSAK